MKVFMSVDLEGVSGVVSFKHQAHPGGFLYEQARKALMRDLNAAIEGAMAGGAEEIVVYDMHYYGLNVILDELPSKDRAMLGKPFDRGLDNSFSAVMLIGFHAMAGMPHALLAHTYTLDTKAIWINDIRVGEIGVEAALAGQHNVPVVMITGDSAGLEEGFQLLGDIELAVVKESLDDDAAKCLPASESRKLIEEKAHTAMKRVKEIEPYKLSPPFEIKMQFSNPGKVERLSREKNIKVQDDSTVIITSDNLEDAWLAYKRVEREIERKEL